MLKFFAPTARLHGAQILSAKGPREKVAVWKVVHFLRQGPHFLHLHPPRFWSRNALTKNRVSDHRESKKHPLDHPKTMANLLLGLHPDDPVDAGNKPCWQSFMLLTIQVGKLGNMLLLWPFKPLKLVFFLGRLWVIGQSETAVNSTFLGFAQC